MCAAVARREESSQNEGPVKASVKGSKVVWKVSVTIAGKMTGNFWDY